MAIQAAHTREELESLLRQTRRDRKTIGFVPTMGALHDGHLSLVRLAKENADIVVISIFVNPTQFAPHEDFDSYPRTPGQDMARLEAAGGDIVFLPSEKEIYPGGYGGAVKAGEAAQAGLEDRFRPTHFDGVANVVSRLFDIVKPDLAVFGQKDYQQLQVVTEMTRALGLPIKIIGAPIVRDEHGLALSSRNAYLSSEELGIARTLNETLFIAAEKIGAGADPDVIIKEAENELQAVGFDKVDYIVVRWNRLLAAAWLGKTRLIDNVALLPG